MNSYIFFLGNNPALSAIELVTTLKREGLLPRIKAGREKFLWLDLPESLPDDFLSCLGGVDRIAKLRAKQESAWTAEELAQVLSPAPSKFNLGISTLNIGDGYDVRRIGFEVKKLFKQEAVKVKFILPQKRGGRLNAAQIIFNKLTSPPNKELTIIKCGDEYLLAETVQIQDIQAYEKRDTSRPVRDARVGMLPPKLAQIMLNLVPSFPGRPPTILDPFCGLGTILQEGYLMGYRVIGSDISERMVEASRKNLASLESAAGPVISLHNVREAFPGELAGKIDAVVTEPDLGEPLTSPLPRTALEKRMRESEGLYLDFFKNIRSVLKDEAWIVFALPAFANKSVDKVAYDCLPDGFLDEVRKLGYSLSQLLPDELKQNYRVSERGTIIYARPDALLGRELTLWHTRKPEGQHN